MFAGVAGAAVVCGGGNGAMVPQPQQQPTMKLQRRHCFLFNHLTQPPRQNERDRGNAAPSPPPPCHLLHTVFGVLFHFLQFVFTAGQGGAA
jgi:hypothetical protein